MTDQGTRRRRLADVAIVWGITLAVFLAAQSIWEFVAALQLEAVPRGVLGVLMYSWLALVLFAVGLVLVALFGGAGWRVFVLPLAFVARFAGLGLLSPIFWSFPLLTLGCMPIFAISVLTAVSISSALTTPAPALPIVRALVIGAALVAAFSLPAQWLDVCFHFSEEPRPVPAPAPARYLATAIGAITLGVVAVALALSRRRWPTVVGAVSTLVFAVVLAVVCALPASC